MLAAEPGRRRVVSDDGLDAVPEAVADFTDLKCPFLLGHSRGVADPAGAAATLSGLPEPEARLVRRAA